MKTIKSAGGPLIGLDRDQIQLWTGIEGKGFIGDDSPFDTDYEAAGYLIDGRTYPPCCVAKITGVAATGLLITMPSQTAVLDLDRNGIYIAQVEYGDPEWGFHRVDSSDFKKAQFNPEHDVNFSCKSCKFIFFDAAYSGRDIGNDFLYFELDEGQYTFSSTVYEQDNRTGLVLCKIMKKISISSSDTAF